MAPGALPLPVPGRSQESGDGSVHAAPPQAAAGAAQAVPGVGGGERGGGGGGGGGGTNRWEASTTRALADVPTPEVLACLPAHRPPATPAERLLQQESRLEEQAVAPCCPSHPPLPRPPLPPPLPCCSTGIRRKPFGAGVAAEAEAEPAAAAAVPGVWAGGAAAGAAGGGGRGGGGRRRRAGARARRRAAAEQRRAAAVGHAGQGGAAGASRAYVAGAFGSACRAGRRKGVCALLPAPASDRRFWSNIVISQLSIATVLTMQDYDLDLENSEGQAGEQQREQASDQQGSNRTEQVRRMQRRTNPHRHPPWLGAPPGPRCDVHAACFAGEALLRCVAPGLRAGRRHVPARCGIVTPLTLSHSWPLLLQPRCLRCWPPPPFRWCKNCWRGSSSSGSRSWRLLTSRIRQGCLPGLLCARVRVRSCACACQRGGARKDARVGCSGAVPTPGLLVALP